MKLYQQSLGAEGSLSEVGTSPPNNLDIPHALVASNTTQHLELFLPSRLIIVGNYRADFLLQWSLMTCHSSQYCYVCGDSKKGDPEIHTRRKYLEFHGRFNVGLV